jgi:hypothetical protein
VNRQRTICVSIISIISRQIISRGRQINMRRPYEPGTLNIGYDDLSNFSKFADHLVVAIEAG